ncbi:MAG: glycoside hydrolase family 2 TIM barrel-domain containing protein [Phycisphaeraceae bacterium]
MAWIRGFEPPAGEVRQRSSLCQRWEFVTQAQRAELGDRGRLPSKYPSTIAVPAAWETVPGLETYRGKAWYRTNVPAPASAPGSAPAPGSPTRALRLVFGGVSHTGTVYADGRQVATHYDAFTPWEVIVPPTSDAERQIIVQVDNTFGDHSALHKENDYYTYGGITRPVEAQWVPQVYLQYLHATPRRHGRGWRLHLRIWLRNWSKQSLTRTVTVKVANAEYRFKPAAIAPGKVVELTGDMDVPNVEAWSASAPALYMLQATLLDEHDTPVDTHYDRIGFREVAVKGKKLLLNGEAIRLRGYNRHEDHPQFGCALPLEAMTTDLEIMRDLGCNFVRTSHYPNDERFLDLCDEMGFYIWEESHARTVDFSHPRFRDQIAVSTAEMLQWHHNHASIIIWGCLNECESRTPPGRAEHQRVLRQIKAADPTRPVTFASMYHKDDICLDLVDIVSWNRYDAWYRPQHGTRDVAPLIKDMLKWLHSPKSKGGSGKPVILSEFGGAALYGYRDPTRAKYTEEYQSDLLDESLRVYLNHPDIVGAAIWQFCDVRVTLGWWRDRPRTHNNKGTVDDYRRRKLSYEAVKRRMQEAQQKWDKPAPKRR